METVQNTIKRTFENKYVYGATILIAILYAGMAAPKLPASVAKLFDQNLFKLVVLFIIAYVSTSDVTVALILAIGFIISIQTLNRISAEDQLKTWLTYTSEREVLEKRKEGMSNVQAKTLQQTKQLLAPVQLPADVGFETGTVESGCYGGVTDTVGYDKDDSLAAFS